MAIKNRSCVWTGWVLLALPMIFFSGCMSGKVSDATMTQDGSLLAFRDSGDVYVADLHSVRRIGSGNSVCMSQTGDRVVWFDTCHTPAQMKVYYPGEGRTVVADLPVEGVTISQAVMFGQSGSLLVRFEIFRDPFPQVAGATTTPAQPVPGSGFDFQYFRWSAKSGWSEPRRRAKDFMPSDGKGDVFVRGTTPLSQGQGDTQAPSTSLVAFGPDGWNARRTVWVRPDGSVVEISRQNDVPVMAVATVALFPIGFWEPLYWGIVFDLPREIGKATAPVDNSAAQRRLDQLVKERAGAKAQK